MLVHGAVGQALLTLGRMAGLELWGTARGDHAALVRELGVMPIDYQREDFTRALPRFTSALCDVTTSLCLRAPTRSQGWLVAPRSLLRRKETRV